MLGGEGGVFFFYFNLDVLHVSRFGCFVLREFGLVTLYVMNMVMVFADVIHEVTNKEFIPVTNSKLRWRNGTIRRTEKPREYVLRGFNQSQC